MAGHILLAEDDKALSALIQDFFRAAGVQVTPAYDGEQALTLAQAHSFDLLVLVEGKSMREIARFVAEKLSTLEGVLSTSTHFHLKTYKKNGCVFEAPVQTERLAVAP